MMHLNTELSGNILLSTIEYDCDNEEKHTQEVCGLVRGLQ